MIRGSRDPRAIVHIVAKKKRRRKYALNLRTGRVDFDEAGRYVVCSLVSVCVMSPVRCVSHVLWVGSRKRF